MSNGSRNSRESPSERWARLLQRMLRAEVRANTLSLIIIVVWIIFLVHVWQDGGRIFTG